jgi:lactate permease
LIGLAIVIPAAKRGFLMPRADEAWDFGPRAQWEPAWIGALDLQEQRPPARNMSILTAWSPYILVAILLVVSRLEQLGVGDLLKSCAVRVQGIFGTDIDHNSTPLYLPGTVLILASLLTFALHRMDMSAYRRACTRSARTLLSASVALVFAVPMVQVFINSGGGASDYAKMPVALAIGVEHIAGGFWPLFSPLVGGIGAAVAGSNTFSNMMFSFFQFNVGVRIGVDPTWIVALQAVGGAAGNTICVHNVVAASAVVGLVGKEGSIIRKTLIVFAYYSVLAGVLGYAMVYGVAS